MIKAAIVGASGYTGGELLRILIAHPEVEVVQATSRSRVGEFLYQTHPNLRKRTQLKFTTPDALEPCDVVFLALPHGEAQKQIETYAAHAPRIVDLSADFRLNDAADYEKWYGEPHHAPEWLTKFVYGLPELHRDAIRAADYVSGVGCNATAANLALLPLVRAGLL
ncbi:MAG TPA: N-acetyl-gamma-glutamyl-phosphate reductase, partial [Anaerolineales bacterium]|nr:N-acetyl-gamma-glutamyl-phosphate reductase [Anaerolineales bacterium]